MGKLQNSLLLIWSTYSSKILTIFFYNIFEYNYSICFKHKAVQRSIESSSEIRNLFLSREKSKFDEWIVLGFYDSPFGCSQPDSTPTNVCKRYIYAHVARCIFEGTYETDDNLFRGRKLGGGQPSYACFHSSQKC